MQDFIRQSLLGDTLYHRCITEGGKIDTGVLTERLELLQSSGQYKNCTISEFAKMCAFHTNPNDSCFSMMKSIQMYYLGPAFYKLANSEGVTYEQIQQHFQHDVQDRRQLLMSFPTRRFVDYLFELSDENNKYVLRDPPSNKTMLYFSNDAVTDNSFLSKDKLALAFTFKDKTVALAQGNFGPPHKGHFNLVRRAVKDTSPDVLIVHAMNAQILNESRHRILDNHGSFRVWQEYAELLFKEFPNLTILYSCQTCHDQYIGIEGDIFRVDCPAHFKTWHEKKSYSWIRSVEKDSSKWWDKVNLYTKEHNKPYSMTQEHYLLRTEQELETDDGLKTPWHVYAREDDNLSATKLSQTIKSGENIDDFIPPGTRKSRVAQSMRFIDQDLQQDLAIAEKSIDLQLLHPRPYSPETIQIDAFSAKIHEMYQHRPIDIWVVVKILLRFLSDIDDYSSAKIKNRLKWYEDGYMKTHELDIRTWSAISEFFQLCKFMVQGRNNYVSRFIETLPSSISSQEEYDEFATNCNIQMKENHQYLLSKGFHVSCDDRNKAIKTKFPYFYDVFYLLSKYL